MSAPTVGNHLPHSTLRRKREDFTVITSVFNPRGFASRYQLYKQFAEYVEQCGVRLVTVEIALGDRPFEVTEAGNLYHLQLRTPWELWHKERAINLGIQRAVQILPDCRYIAWVDADVTFLRHDWAAATCEALQHHHVVQMFGEMTNLNSTEQNTWIIPGAFRCFQEKGYWFDNPKVHGGGHPGLAWAARRETLDKLGGLIDFAISGSGDSHMANLLLGLRDKGDFRSSLDGYTQAFLHRLSIWGDLCDRHVRQNVGFVPGMIAHHWHGPSNSRGYKERWDAAKAHKFDPTTDLIVDCSGLYRLVPGRDKMGDDIRRSLSQRNEDSL